VLVTRLNICRLSCPRVANVIEVRSVNVIFLAGRLCHDATNHLDVILSESEASAFPTGYEKADSSAVPKNDILTQSRGPEDRTKGE
jgi:hypothetical protein